MKCLKGIDIEWKIPVPQTGGGGRDRERILGTRRNKQTKKKKSSHTEKRKDSVREIYSEGNLSFLIECTLKKKKNRTN